MCSICDHIYFRISKITVTQFCFKILSYGCSFCLSLQNVITKYRVQSFANGCTRYLIMAFWSDTNMHEGRLEKLEQLQSACKVIAMCLCRYILFHATSPTASLFTILYILVTERRISTIYEFSKPNWHNFTVGQHADGVQLMCSRNIWIYVWWNGFQTAYLLGFLSRKPLHFV